jgi:N-formylmaleamate deformylase
VVSPSGTRPPHWTEGDIDVDDDRPHFHRTGRDHAPPLVLLHGLSDNGLCWTRAAQILESDFDVVMLDARNHGDSATAPATSME